MFLASIERGFRRVQLCLIWIPYAKVTRVQSFIGRWSIINITIWCYGDEQFFCKWTGVYCAKFVVCLVLDVMLMFSIICLNQTSEHDAHCLRTKVCAFKVVTLLINWTPIFWSGMWEGWQLWKDTERHVSRWDWTMFKRWTTFLRSIVNIIRRVYMIDWKARESPLWPLLAFASCETPFLETWHDNLCEAQFIHSL
jgi:hypothetical protein